MSLFSLSVSANVEWRAPIQIDTTPVAAVAKSAPARLPFFNVFDVQLRHSMYRPEFKGNTARASKVERTYDEQHIAFRTARSWSDYLWTSQWSVRRTDDPQVSATKNHEWDLLSLVSTLAYKDRWNLNFGNVYPNFHRYALTSSLEGLHGNYRLDFKNKHRIELSAASGRSARGLDNSRYTRWVSGANILWASPQNWWSKLEFASLRVSGSTIYDDPASIDNAAPPARVQARALGLRLESRIAGGFTFDADYGLATGQQNIRGSREQTGGAFAANLGYRRPSNVVATGWRRLTPLSLRGSYEVVGDDYFAPQASAGADQLRWSVAAEHPFYSWMGYRWGVNHSEDNAREKRLHTNATLSQNHNINLKLFHMPFLARLFRIKQEDEMAVEELVEKDTAPPRWIDRLELGNMRMTLDFRRTERASTNATSNVNVEDYSAGIGHRMAGWSIGGLFAWQTTDNDLAAAQDRRTENWSVNAGRAWNVKTITIQTNAGFRRGYDALRTGAQSNRTENTNASISALWREFSAGLDWNVARIKRNIGGGGSRTHNARLNMGYRPPLIPGLDIRLGGTLSDINEDNALQNFRSRDIRLDLVYDIPNPGLSTPRAPSAATAPPVRTEQVWRGRLKTAPAEPPDFQHMHVENLLELGIECIKREGFVEAENYFLAALRFEPQNPRAYFNLAVARYSRMDYRGSAKAFEKVTSLTPDDAESHFYLGLSRFRSDDLRRAEKSFRRVIEIDDDHPYAGQYLRKIEEERNR